MIELVTLTHTHKFQHVEDDPSIDSNSSISFGDDDLQVTNIVDEKNFTHTFHLYLIKWLHTVKLDYNEQLGTGQICSL